MTDEALLNGLVLAGGRSRRMGSDKAALVRDGETQLALAMGLIDRFARDTFVSVQPDQVNEPLRAQFPQIVDRYDDIGPINGVLSAMDHDPGAAWLVLACDLPNVTAETIDALLQARDRTQPFTAFRSSHNELPEPLCAVYEPQARELIEGFLAEGIRCPRKMMIKGGAKLVTQNNPAWLANVNTPEDLGNSSLRAAS